jgi:aminoglycoside phosphotransferase (APT) family kinase protein
MEISAILAQRLVAAQFPHWADLPVRAVEHGGWDNRTFHLGDAMTIRLPSAEGYVPQIAKEHRWLPALAPHLPLPIPTPIAVGEPGAGYPFAWSIYGWIDGDVASSVPIGALVRFADDLGSFLFALESVDATDGPAPGLHSAFRGGPPARWDAEVRAAITKFGDSIDGKGATGVWNAALAAEWDGSPVWFHGDVAVGNLLVRDGRLAAVIDFGCSGVGDPACDTVIAWTLFAGASRDAFRAALPLDAATWMRGRGWALWKALITLAGHVDAEPVAATEAVVQARRTLAALVEDE